jgi:hypothetical protein
MNIGTARTEQCPVNRSSSSSKLCSERVNQILAGIMGCVECMDVNISSNGILRRVCKGNEFIGRRKEVFLAYRFALQYYRSRVSSRSELLSTLVTKFGDPRGAATSFPIGPSCIPYSAPRGDLAAPMLLWLWAEPFLMMWSCFFTVNLTCLWIIL